MKRSKWILGGVPLALMAAIASGCAEDASQLEDGPKVATAEQAVEIPSTVSDTAKLTQAYDSERKELKFRSCVTGQIIQSGNTKSVIQLRKNLNFDDVQDALSGSLSVGLTIPVIKAQAGAKLAIAHSRTSYTETQHLLALITAPSDVLNPDTIAVAPGYTTLAGTPEAEKRCGNEFISEVRRGASLIATLKIEFLNKTDQQEFGGKLSINILNNMVEGSGELNNISTEKLERTQLTIEVEQLGGDPIQLMRVMPDKIMTCSLLNRQPCIEVFENLIAYAKNSETGFLAQLNQGTYNVLNYKTQAYEDSNAWELPPPEYTPVDPAVKQRITLIEGKLRAAMEDEQRASNLLKNVGYLLSDSDRTRIDQILTMASENVVVYADISTYCYKNMTQACLVYSQTNEALAHGAKADGGYDRSELEVTPAVAPPPPPACPGCVVGGTCIPSGGTEPGNPCHVCDPARNSAGYSNASEGSACDDGQFCSDASVCRAGLCTATVPHSCPANTFCDEVFNTCQCIKSDWYRDADGDGYGDPNSAVAACARPAGYVANGSDCCDVDSNARPGQTQYFGTQNACGNWDYDCSGAASYSLGCESMPSGTKRVTNCGCITKGTCNTDTCGSKQSVSYETCHQTYGCSAVGGSASIKRTLQCR